MCGGEAVGSGEAALTDVGADGFAGVLAHGAVEVKEAEALDAIIGASVLADHCGESGGQGVPRG